MPGHTTTHLKGTLLEARHSAALGPARWAVRAQRDPEGGQRRALASERHLARVENEAFKTGEETTESDYKKMGTNGGKLKRECRAIGCHTSYTSEGVQAEDAASASLGGASTALLNP